ncbi:MAG TPA: hypothetical protein VFO39_06055 [Candidatus Sulfotelmatobacter sp.]|nr:hypothetical protein [Candidatus Sulfotelmatobacter sp.]
MIEQFMRLELMSDSSFARERRERTIVHERREDTVVEERLFSAAYGVDILKRASAPAANLTAFPQHVINFRFVLGAAGSVPTGPPLANSDAAKLQHSCLAVEACSENSKTIPEPVDAPTRNARFKTEPPPRSAADL